MAQQEKVATTVPLTLERGVLHELSALSASNVDQELGWTRKSTRRSA